MSGSPVAIHADGQSMWIVHLAGLACALLIAACSGAQPAPPGVQPPSAVETVAPASSPAPPPSPPTSAIATPGSAAALKSANPAVTPPATASQSTVKPAPPATKPAAATAKAPVAQPAKKESTASNVAKKASPTLNLTSLEQRLKDTDAIGVLTKIALKNQVDDLLDQFRAYYQGKLKITLAELRRPYDLLVLKVLSLLQDSDPSLASAIVASREAIWGILSDPAKFATI
jgi:type IV secretory pathway VirB10-like protein